eukprot:6210099-Pleurochrysis_carterae.AAC.1
MPFALTITSNASRCCATTTSAMRTTTTTFSGHFLRTRTSRCLDSDVPAAAAALAWHLLVAVRLCSDCDACAHPCARSSESCQLACALT